MTYPKCPYCDTEINVIKPGQYVCMNCRKPFSATQQGDPPAIALTPVIQNAPIASRVPSRRQATRRRGGGFMDQLRIVSWGALCCFIAGLIGQYSPGGLATIAQPGSPLRNQTAILYGAVGLLLGMILGCLMVIADRK